MPLQPPSHPGLSWHTALRALREASGVTQEGWAAHLGVGRRTLQRWELGQLVPDARDEANVVAVCQAKGLFRRHQAGPLAGVTVSPEWLGARLVSARLAKHAAAGAGRVPPERDPAPSATGQPLPIALTSLIGREGDVTAVGRLLATARLVTLTGPGGVGKTRLALAVATGLRDDYADGVVFVPLAALTDPDLVPAAILQGLNVRETDPRRPVDVVADSLGSKQLLLVLDNLEHLLAASPVVTRLLATCPALTVLATSRAPLALTGEHEYPVAPLALPDVDGAAAVDAVLRAAAVRLFVERATAVKPDFAVRADAVPVIAAICARLDGLPLALELAATRAKVFPPPVLLARLDRRLPLLTGGPRDAPVRQRTLRDTIAWSYDLLTPDAQALFRRLAVFAGGATLAAAEAVCATGGNLRIDVLTGLTAVVEHSLVRQVDDMDGELRFTMLATIREFALEQLAASGEADAMQRAHAAFVLTVVRQSAQRADGPDVRYVATELPNIREALRWCAAAGEVGLGTRILWSLVWAAFQLGLSRELGTWAEQFLTLPEAVPPSMSRARLMYTAAEGANAVGDRTRQRSWLEDAVALSRFVGDTACLAQALSTLGFWHLNQGDTAVAAPLLDECLTLYRGLGDRRGVAWSLFYLGTIGVQRHDLEAARALHGECLRMARALGDPVLVGYGLTGQALVAECLGDRVTARRLIAEVLSLTGAASENIIGINNRNALARLWLDDDDRARALPLLAESLHLTRRHGLMRDLHTTLAQMARVALAHTDAVNAARLLGASETQRKRTGIVLAEAERDAVARYTAAVRAVLSDDPFAAAYAEGRALSLDAGVTLALAQR